MSEIITHDKIRTGALVRITHGAGQSSQITIGEVAARRTGLGGVVVVSIDGLPQITLDPHDRVELLREPLPTVEGSIIKGYDRTEMRGAHLVLRDGEWLFTHGQSEQIPDGTTPAAYLGSFTTIHIP